MIAALYVQERGCYVGLDGLDPWTEARDARTYAGPWPVVAHPPCARWGRYATGGPRHHGRFVVGDDDGCFAAAVAAVRQWGGVLEHPAGSKAWAAHDLARPPRSGGWVRADAVGWTCCVEQGHYGHPARKASWLYTVRLDGTEPPPLSWGPAAGTFRRGEGTTARERRRGALERLSRRQREATPAAFRDLLLLLAGALDTPGRSEVPGGVPALPVAHNATSPAPAGARVEGAGTPSPGDLVWTCG